jgi:hypothetical protein
MEIWYMNLKKSGVNITRLSITFAEYVSPEPEPPTVADFWSKISYLKILPM